MTSDRKYNLVVFGATGMTGRHMIIEIVKVLASAPVDEQFTWAVAGRTISKLNSVLKEVSNCLQKDLSGVDKVLADISDPNSLREMARQTDVVLNFVGPYLRYGEVVVKACVDEGTHHLDLAAEDQFLEEIQLKYKTAAETSGSLIIGATGFGSIPSDYGSTYLEENFDGELNSVESYINTFNGLQVPELHLGTWNSVLLMINRFSELTSLKKQLYPDPYFQFEHKLSVKPFITYNKDLRAWCFPIPFPDIRVMDRTQRYKFYELRRRPAQTQVYIQLPNFWFGILFSIALGILVLFARFQIGLKLLLKYPKLFSLGIASTEGRTKEKMDQPFTFTLIGRGWDRSTGPHSGPPNKKLILKVRGKNAAVEGTVAIMLHAGLTIIKERRKMPFKGGVYTPGIAFAGTSLAERLTANGVTFTINKCIETWVDMTKVV